MSHDGQIAIVDYGLANIRSVINAVECLGSKAYVATTGAELKGAAKIILPGVGSYATGMRGLRERGHEAVLNELVIEGGVPLIGICLGFQFLFEGSNEGDEPGLGWIPGHFVEIPRLPEIKVPHMGWNDVTCPRPTRLFAELAAPVEFYFVHSFCMPNEGEAADCAAAVCDYGLQFVAAVERGNIFGTQFHPEKSQMAGMKLLQNFLSQ